MSRRELRDSADLDFGAQGLDLDLGHDLGLDLLLGLDIVSCLYNKITVVVIAVAQLLISDGQKLTKSCQLKV